MPPLLLGGVLVVVFEALLVVGVHEVAAVDAGDAVVAVLEVGVVAVVVGGLGDVVLWGGRCGHGGGGEGRMRRRTASRMCGEHDTTVPGNAVHRSSPRNIAGWAVFRTRIVRGFSPVGPASNEPLRKAAVMSPEYVA